MRDAASTASSSGASAAVNSATGCGKPLSVLSASILNSIA